MSGCLSHLNSHVAVITPVERSLSGLPDGTFSLNFDERATTLDYGLQRDSEFLVMPSTYATSPCGWSPVNYQTRFVMLIMASLDQPSVSPRIGGL